MIRILIVDDHAVYTQALAFMLEREPDMTVVGRVSDIAAARGYFNQVTLAIIDLDLAGETGIDLLRELKAVNPKAVALIVTAAKDRAELGLAIESGAAGVLHKSAGIREVVEATRKVSEGGYLHTTLEVVELLRSAAHKHEEDRQAEGVTNRLTPRERDVLRELAKGLSDNDIAASLRLSPETVRTHMVNILRKLDANSRLQALVLSVRYGVVKIK